jgi:hypothetical protein
VPTHIFGYVLSSRGEKALGNTFIQRSPTFPGLVRSQDIGNKCGVFDNVNDKALYLIAVLPIALSFVLWRCC